MTGDDGGTRNTPKRRMSFGCFFFLFHSFFYITVLTFFLATMHSFSDNCHLFRRRRPQTRRRRRRNEGGASGAMRKVPKRRHTTRTSLGHSVCFFFFYFHITNYFLVTKLVFRHPTPVSSTTGIIYHNDRERWGNERGLRGYEENAQETSYNNSWGACSKFFFTFSFLVYITTSANHGIFPRNL
jgi:hypothetical protein